MSVVLELRDVAKSFTLHLQGGVQLSIVAGVAFSVRAGECVVLSGPSGAGKSSILKMVFGNYRCDQGQILVRQDGQGFDVATADPRRMLALRRSTIGYVSQFLRAVPRVPAIDVIAEPLVANGTPRQAARERAAELLKRLSIPEQLWSSCPQPSPAVNNNASTSPAASCRTCRSCCWTSRPRLSMPPIARPCEV